MMCEEVEQDWCYLLAFNSIIWEVEVESSGGTYEINLGCLRNTGGPLLQQLFWVPLRVPTT